MSSSTEGTAVEQDDAVLAKLGLLDRFLPVWILLAMAGGLLLGRLVPSLQTALDAVKVEQASLPIALGLLLMMYPVLAKVHYEDMGHVTSDRKMLWGVPAAELGHRATADVHPGVGFPIPLPHVPHRSDRDRTGPLHRDGAHLERPGLRRPRGRGAAGSNQLRVPDRRLLAAGNFLPEDSPGLVGAGHP
jgi:hypothetical protein